MNEVITTRVGMVPQPKRLCEWPKGATPALTEDEIKAQVPPAVLQHLVQHGMLEGPARHRYFDWLNNRATDYANREDDKTCIGSRVWIRAFLHRAVTQTAGKCHYTGQNLEWHHIGGKECDQPFAPSFDHDRFQSGSRLTYFLTSVRVNRSKQNLSIGQWLRLADEVRSHVALHEQA